MNSRLLAQIKSAIGSNEVLSRLGPLARSRLAARATLQELERGDVIFNQGWESLRFGLVVRGEVKLLEYTSNGAALMIDLILPDQLFGMVFHDRNPAYPYTAVAATRVGLLSFHQNDLTDDLDRNPFVLKLLLTETSRKLSHSHEMRGIGLEAAPVRIARLLLYLHERYGLVIPQTRATLAELAGTTVETAIRVTKDLARRGILATGRGRIEVLSLPELRACAGNDLASMSCVIEEEVRLA